MNCRDSALSCWVPLSHASHGTPFTTCKQLYCTIGHVITCPKQVAQLHVSANLSLTQLCHQVSSTLQATPANWPYNHDSIGKKGWAFLLPTVTPEDAKKHFPDHHSCKVYCHPALRNMISSKALQVHSSTGVDPSAAMSNDKRSIVCLGLCALCY